MDCSALMIPAQSILNLNINLTNKYNNKTAKENRCKNLSYSVHSFSLTADKDSTFNELTLFSAFCGKDVLPSMAIRGNKAHEKNLQRNEHANLNSQTVWLQASFE